MIRQAFDRGEVHRYVAALDAHLDHDDLKDAVSAAAATVGGDGDPVATIRSKLPDVSARLASSGGRQHPQVPYLSRDPFQSLLQSTVEERLRDHGVPDARLERRGVFSAITHFLASLIRPVRFGPTDSRWVINIGIAVLQRLAAGNHPFNPQPALYAIDDDARLVVVGDWGTGLERACAVAGYMADEVREALAQGRQAHVIHLGDVYYSGLPHEVERNVLAPGRWPVTDELAAAGVTSWALNGNHDMYGGGFGYFETLLADQRWQAQRSSDGQPTSYFRLTSPSWNIVGLDTAWDRDPLSEGHTAVLEDPQAEFVAETAADNRRKLMLLSHHQLISAYDEDDLDHTLEQKLGPVLRQDRVTAWLWGHEHRCMAFAPGRGVKFPRCIGHGGVPVTMPRGPDDPVDAPGLWEERGSFVQRRSRWARFGFAVLDMAGDRIDVRYRDDQGIETRRETIA
jgi:hypothetical protein